MSTAVHESYTNTLYAPEDATLVALNDYLDAHSDPSSSEFALHALVGLVGIDRDLLQSRGDQSSLVQQRERIYELTCNRLANTPPEHIATAIDEITTTLDTTCDPVLQQVVDTLTAIKPAITSAPLAEAPIAPVISLIDRLPKSVPSKRVVQGLVVTAIATSIAAGVAPKAAAETIDPNSTDGTLADAMRSLPSAETPNADVTTFFETVFNENAPTQPDLQSSTPEKAATQPSPQEVAARNATYWKRFTHPPEGSVYHRSGRVPYAFENSPEGIAYANAHGYKRIDLDIQVTKDGVPVVTHTATPLGRDRIFEGFTDTAGKLKSSKMQIKDMTFEEVSRLKHKNGYKIYSLEHMIGLASKTNLSLFLELKTPHLLKKHLPEIASMLNAAQVEAVIAGQTRKTGQLDALAQARKLGFWTRNITAGTWSKPSHTAKPDMDPPKDTTPTTTEPSLDDNSASTPDTPATPATDQDSTTTGDHTAPNETGSDTSSMDEALNGLFEGTSDTTQGDPEPAETTPASAAPAAPTEQASPTTDTGADALNTKIDQAADDITSALVAGNDAKIKSEFQSAQEKFGDIGTLFITFDVVDTPASERPSGPTAEPTPGNSTGDNKDKNNGEKQSAPKYGKLLSLIASFESGGNYNAYFGHGGNQDIKFTSMKVGDVIEWQRKYVANGSPSSAVGKYQFLVGTLRTLTENYGISKDEIFDKGLQDKLAIILLKQRGLNSYLKGDMSAEAFAHNLSKEWSSLPSVTGDHPNASYYDGDGLNKAHIKVGDLLDAVRSVKAKPAEAAKSGDQGSSDNGSCAPGTDEVKGITTGWTRSGEKKDLTLCAIPGTQVISSTATPHWKDERYKGTTAAGETRIAVSYKIAKDALRMAEAAKQDGLTLTATIGYRSLAEQCSIVMKKHGRPAACPDWVTPVSGNWSSNVVYSNHMLGQSIDFYGSSINWMKKNGSKFGFTDDVYKREGWDQAHFTNKG